MCAECRSTSQSLPLDTHTSTKELLRKSLLGSEIVNTQFYLFSAKSASPEASRVAHPRVLCTNDVFLSDSSKYFCDLLKSKTSSDTSLIEIIGDSQEIPGEAPIEDYGYESDSDLEDDHSLESTDITAPPRPGNGRIELEDSVEVFGNRPASVTSDIIVVDPEEGQKSGESAKERSPSANKARVLDWTNDTILMQTTTPRSQNARRILIKDTAFRTWYALLYYLYTGEVTFLPPKSAHTQRASLGPLDVPRCSAKSMYRLATKIDLEPLRSKALEFLQHNITEQNVLKELESSLLSRYPPLLETVLDRLFANIASEPVVTGFSAIAKRISRNEVRHGADIVIGLHQELLKKHHSGDFGAPLKKGKKGMNKVTAVCHC